jgi:tight adherence protein B
MNPILLLIMLASVFMIAVALFFAGTGQRRIARRARRVLNLEKASRKQSDPKLRLDQPKGFDALVSRFVPRPTLLRQRLAATGLTLSISAYAMICLTVAMAIVLVALLQKLPPLAALLVGSVGGLLLPHMAIGWLIGERRKKFSKLFPDAIGLMVRGLKAGLPAIESMLIVGREVPAPIGEEFRRVGDQVRVGQSIEDALWAIARRIQLPEFNFLVITMAIQRETGGNLAETLENLDDMLRKRHQMKLKVKAMSSEAVATAAIIGSMPFVMSLLLFFVSHDYIMKLVTTGLGHILLGGAIFWMCIGFFVMSQMIKFEI